MVSRSFFGIVRYKIMSSANKYSLTSSLHICIPFISSYCVIALARNSKTIMNRSRQSGHLCLVPDFRGNGFSFSSFSIMLTIGLLYIAFIVLSYVPYILSFIRVFIRKGC
jgi:hypothetical protein